MKNSINNILSIIFTKCKAVPALLVLMLFLCSGSIAQTNKGKDFWLAETPNLGNRGDFAISVANPSLVPATIQITNPIRATVNAVIAPGALQTFLFTTESSSIQGTGTFVNNVYHVTSDKDVVVYDFTPLLNSATNDAALILPTNSLGKKYRPGSYVNALGNSNGSFFGVVATANATNVKTYNRLGVLVDNVTINQGQYFQRNNGSTVALDITGWYIETDKPAAVFSGNICTSIGSSTGACDHIDEQVLPLESMASAYIAGPTLSRPIGCTTPGTCSPDVFRYVATEDGTIITTSPNVGGGTINKGQFVEISTSTAHIVSSNNKPFYGYQYLISQNSGNPVAGTGDPAMMGMPPVDQFQFDYLFLIPTSFTSNFINVVAPVGTVFTFDGSPLTYTCTPVGVLNAITYCTFHISVTPGSHRISANNQFGLVISGFGNFASYGYLGGVGLQPINAGCNTGGPYQLTACNLSGIQLNGIATCPDGSAPTPVELTGTDGVTFSNPNTANPIATVPGYGTFAICLKVTCAGNTVECCSQITVSQPPGGCGTPPSITCPGDQTINSELNSCSATANYTATVTGNSTPVVTYSLSGATTGTGNGTGSGLAFNTGMTTVTLTATNQLGTATCMFTVTVVDNQPPSITCPGPLTIQCDAPVPDPDINSVIVSDNCNTGITVTWVGDQFTPGNCPNSFTITRTYQAKDASNNVATCTQIITVVDNTPPTLTVPADVTLQCNDPLPLKPLNVNSSPNFIDGTYNIGTAIFGAPLTSTPLTANAEMVIDDDGNPYDACDSIINDLTGKIAVIERSGCTAPQSFFVNKAYKAQQAGAVGVIFIFNQPGNFVATMGLPPGPNPTITIPLMLVSNDYGNALKAEILAGPVNVSMSAPTVIANDACSFTSITHQQTFTPGNCPSNYTLVNTWTATDQCGNATTASQTITVIDNTPPTLTVPADATLQCSDPLPLMPVNINSSPNGLTGTYNLGTAVFGPALTATPVTGDAELVDDGAGNPADACEPILNSLTGKIAVIDRGGCSAPNAFFTSKVLKAQNAGAIAVIVVNSQPGDNILTMGGANPLITIPSVFVSNNYGNALKASMALGTVNVSLSASTVTATDNCSSPVITYSEVVTPGNCPGNYSILKTWTATDACGNATTSSQTITVVDNTAPVITCPGDITVNNTAGQCGANVSFTATGTDNCGSPVITYSHNPGSFFAVGTTLVTATATDACGNTAECSFNVIVNDNEKPVITVSNIFRCFEVDNFGCSINLGATATDNCQVVSLTSNAPGCFPVGTTTVTWTATDNHGNVTTKTQMVTRNPEINISICAGPTRTIYRGTASGVGPFGPQSVNLGSTVTGGTPGYTYSWSPAAGLSNANIANPVANPAVTTTYTLTVTDSKGCQRSLSITINVLPLSSAICSGNGNNVKFAVCHIPPGNPSNPQNICISVNALNAHLTSGSNGHNNCYLGPCQQNCFSTVPGGQSFVGGPTDTKEVVYTEVPDESHANTEAFKVNVYPNPSAGEFNLQVFSKSSEPITVRILDVNGAVRSTNTVISKMNSVKVGSNLTGGTYMAEVIQGVNRAIVKLVKLN